MGGVWGREEETEDEETAGEEEEAEEEEAGHDKEDKEVSWRGGSAFSAGEGVSYEDEEVNRALVVNIKEKIIKLEERVSTWQPRHHQHHQRENHCLQGA